MTLTIEQISDKKIWIHDGGTSVMELDTVNGVRFAAPMRVDQRVSKLSASELDMSAGTPTSHPINLEGTTLAGNTNAIRGANVNPTRASGWISFSGTVGATPAQVYTDYRELHTTGVAEVLGFGSFPYMDSGSLCASMYGGQDIAFVSAGATVLTAGGAASVGVFARWAKLAIDTGATFASGAVAATMFLSVQDNIGSLGASDISVFNIENASGLHKSMLHLTNTAQGFTNLLWLPDDGLPASLTNANDLNDISATPNAGWIKVLVGSTVRYIPLYALKA